MLITEIIGLPPLEIYSNSKIPTRQSSDPNLLYGIELEIENVPMYEEMTFKGIYSEEDGSLRNDGREFITAPMNFSNLSFILEKFFTKNELTQANYSERTSVHVHANCRDLTAEQLQSIILLYQVFEKLIFSYIGDERDKSIFCVPLCETTLTNTVIGKLISTKNLKELTRWMKYTALNVLPLFKYGTIEFRHMAGTSDYRKILEWCDVIGNLFVFGKTNEFEYIRERITRLNTSSEYDVFLDSVFKNNSKLLRQNRWKESLEEGVLEVKYMLLDQKQISSRYFNMNDILFRN